MATRSDAGVVQGRLDDVATGGGPAADTGYRGPQVCAIVGITYRQLDYWARTDLVRPSLADAQGSGTQRRYSYRDLLRLRVVKKLLDAGLRLSSARRAIEYLRSDLGEDWATANLVLDGSDSVLVRRDDELIDVVRSGQGVLNILALKQVADEIDASIHALEPTREGRGAATDPASTEATGTR